tara:strand:- start:312 stop:2009 length:1698 start_codon:yes stop_codon:yes gene_type:complete
MFKNILTLLKRIRYNFTNLSSPSINMPDKQNKFNYVETDIKNFVNNYFKNDDLSFPVSPTHDNIGIHVFGSEREYFYDYEYFAFDDFNKISFSKKSFKPAFFNKGDVKVSFEKSRLQHHQKQNKYHPIPKYFKEFGKNFRYPQIFWNSPMDVAIRNINLILIYLRNKAMYNSETFEFYGNPWIEGSENYENYALDWISYHYEYLLKNLENKGNVVGNHYLVELSSILFTLANFEFEDKMNHFKKFENELSSQIEKQFYKSGLNFEGSTHYSLFVTEALIICKLSLSTIDKNSYLIQRIDQIIHANKFFLKQLTIDGELSQIGDNDSGRIFYRFFDEINPLKIDWFFTLYSYFYKFDAVDLKLESFKQEINNKNIDFSFTHRVQHKKITLFTKDYEFYSFKDFGIYIWRNDDEYFSIRCGPVGQNGTGGHSHYDQLSIECFKGNSWIARDPGTGTYTDDIKKRNNFRSLNYHWGPKPNIEFPKEDEFDCFKLKYISDGEVLQFDKYNFLGFADFNGKRIYRKITISDGVVNIEDFSNNVELEEYTSWGERNNGIKVKFSNGYKRIS